MQIHIPKYGGAASQYNAQMEEIIYQQRQQDKEGGYGEAYKGLLPILLGNEIEIDKVRALEGYLFVEFPEYTDGVIAVSDSGIYIDATYNPYTYHPRYAKVLSGCHLEGKTVFFNYLVFSACRDFEQGYCLISKNGRLYGFMPSTALYCDETKKCYNGWVLCEPIQDELSEFNGIRFKESGSGIAIAIPKEKHKLNESIVVGVSDESELTIGNLAVMEAECDLPLESSYRKFFDKEYFIVEESTIMYSK